jgi:hypothetical protein
MLTSRLIAPSRNAWQAHLFMVGEAHEVQASDRNDPFWGLAVGARFRFNHGRIRSDGAFASAESDSHSKRKRRICDPDVAGEGERWWPSHQLLRVPGFLQRRYNVERGYSLGTPSPLIYVDANTRQPSNSRISPGRQWGVSEIGGTGTCGQGGLAHQARE